MEIKESTWAEWEEAVAAMERDNDKITIGLCLAGIAALLVLVSCI